MEYTDGKVFGSDECIRLGSSDGKLLGTIIGNFMEAHLGLILKQSWTLLYGSIYGSNGGKLE